MVLSGGIKSFKVRGDKSRSLSYHLSEYVFNTYRADQSQKPSLVRPVMNPWERSGRAVTQCLDGGKKASLYRIHNVHESRSP